MRFYFKIIGLLFTFLLGSVFFHFIDAKDRLGNTPGNKEKIVVELADGMLKEIDDFSNNLLSGCPHYYETASHIYYFRDKDLVRRHQACIDLQKTACEGKDIYQFGKSVAEQIRLNQEYHAGLRSAVNYDHELERRLSNLSPSNRLLKKEAFLSAQAHLKYLNKDGRKAMLEFFKKHYAKGDLGLTLFKKDFLENILKFPRGSPLLDLDESVILHSLSAHPDATNKDLIRMYEDLFEHLSDDDLVSFIGSFVFEMHDEFTKELEHKAWENPSFHKRIKDLFFPPFERRRVEKQLAEVKKNARDILRSIVAPPLIDHTLSRIDSIYLVWPPNEMDSSKILYDLVTTQLAYFNQPEGNKKPEIHIGRFFFHLNDWTVFFTLAHEMGHSIDPKSSKTWSKVWGKLQGCFKSLGFKDHQMGEVFADWFATEVTLKAIEETYKEIGFPSRWKTEALLDSIFFCHKEEVETEDDRHPPGRERVNSIIRAHPAVGRILGCGVGPPYRKYCRPEE